MQAERALTRVPATANAAGVVKSWTVEPGTVVETGQELGILDRDDLGEEQVTAPCSGKVGRGIAVGARVKADAKLIYVESTSPPPLTRQERYAELDFGTNYGTTHGTSRGTDVVSQLVPHEEPSTAPSEEPSAVPPVERSRVPCTEPQVVPIVLTSDDPIRTEPETYYLATDQIQDIIKDADDFQAELGYSLAITKTEVARAALQAYLDLPRPARLALVRQNRENEEKMGIGAGAKRGRPPGKKNTSIHLSGASKNRVQQSKRGNKNGAAPRRKK